MSKEVKFERLVIGSAIFSYSDVLLSAIAKYLNPDISIERSGFVFTHYDADKTIIFDYNGINVHEKCRQNLERFKYVYVCVEDFVKEFSDLIFPENTDYHMKKFEDMFFKNNDTLVTIVRNANKVAGETYHAHFNEIVDVFVTFIKNLVRQANADDKSYEVWLKAINESKDGIILLPDIFYRLPGRLDLRLLDSIYFVIVEKTVKDGVLKDDERALMPLCSFYHDEPEEKIIRITKEIENEPGCMYFFEGSGVAQFNTEENARKAALKMIENAFSKEKKIPTEWSKYDTVVVRTGGHDFYDVLFVALAKCLNPDIKVVRLDSIYTNIESPETTLIYNRDQYFISNNFESWGYYNKSILDKSRVYKDVSDFLDECANYIFPFYTKTCVDKLYIELYFDYGYLVSKKEEDNAHFDLSIGLIIKLIKNIQINADFMHTKGFTIQDHF